ncbi:hypothetical protein NQ651_17880, partial [Acinetobacter baumannii]|nr:hypothetical protein [Acinetobacter baumannii]
HETEQIYFLDKDLSVYILDDKDVTGRLPYTWTSKLFDVGGDGARFLAGQVVADGYENLKMRIFCDNTLLYEKILTNRRPFRIPNHSRHYEWQLEITGTEKVRDVVIAESMLELNK